MGFRTIIVNAHSKLTYKNNHLFYRSADQSEMIHLSEIDILICETTDIVISTMLMTKLNKAGVAVIFCDEKRLPNSMLIPYYARNDSSLQVQHQINWSNSIKETVWTAIIQQKLRNQATIIMDAAPEKYELILQSINRLEVGDPSNVEGHVARIYFNGLFGPTFIRDEENDINAALDYGYTLLLSMFAREIVKTGCITQLGIKHANQFNDFNLASDLMEPFRILVDQIVYENQTEQFSYIKKQLFNLFNQTYLYGNSEMYLTNIVSDYVKKTIDCLHKNKTLSVEFKVIG